VRIRGGEAEAINVKSRTDRDDVAARARYFLKMIDKFRKIVRFLFWVRGRFLIVFFLGIKLPDLDFAINARSEGRVLVPWEYRNDTSLAHQEPFGVFWLPPSLNPD
jgi:hypothetical protein